MFERFTDRARRVVVQAQEEARVLNHNYIGTEHILLGLIREGEGVAARALESLGISLEAVRQQVEDIIRRGQQAPSGHVPFTPRAKKVLQLSLREALQLGHAYIGTEHILLGLVREGEGVAAQVLVKLGADMNRVRQEVIQLLHGYPAGGAEAGRAEARTWPPRLEGHAEQLDEIIGRLDSIAGRLAAIERRLGILDEPKPPQDRKTAGEPEPTAGDTGIVAVTEEAAGLRGEVGRLQALLRQHGIEPDDGGPDDSEPDDIEPDVGEPDDGQPQAGRPGR